MVVSMAMILVHWVSVTCPSSRLWVMVYMYIQPSTSLYVLLLVWRSFQSKNQIRRSTHHIETPIPLSQDARDQVIVIIHPKQTCC